MEHDLKIWPQYFVHIQSGSKTFEVRNNDRGFQPGDTVILREWDPEPKRYSGRQREFRIGYVLPIDTDRVAFSLLPTLKEPVKDGWQNGDEA
jgi:ASC-1-like (ASCH) protein